ncbi:MAG TPA: 50S ribosomal protein L2 [Candidatus Eisenbacteria bacterium]|nr:50S ribosomal protein L2 [Candidatus Eisenbacteria bacterium]
MKLKQIRKKNSGRNNSGKVTVRHQGGGEKRFHRTIDFKRDKVIAGVVAAIEYDPNRTCDIALIQYTDGEKRYILCPEGLKVGDSVVAGQNVEIKVGNAMPMSQIPVGTFIHNVELTPGKGGQLAKSAGVSATLAAREGGYAHLKMPSGEVRKVPVDGMATVGQVGRVGHKNEVIGKAGRARHMGIRPTVRGVAQNPRSHPHGGGEGRSGIGLKRPKTYAGRTAVGKRRHPKKYSNKYILQKRKNKRGQ